MAKLSFRYGAMGCGKTTQLLQVAYNYEKNGFKIVVLKPEVDKKGGQNIVSRLGVEREVDKVLTNDIPIVEQIDFENLHSIIVDEAQFLNYKQVEELWLISKVYNIPVLAYELKTSFTGHLFEGSMALMEKADEIEELATICKCGKKARFNARKILDDYTLTGNEVAIDGIDATYEAMCPDCYIEKVLKINKENVKQKVKM